MFDERSGSLTGIVYEGNLQGTVASLSVPYDSYSFGTDEFGTKHEFESCVFTNGGSVVLQTWDKMGMVILPRDAVRFTIRFHA